ncbi:hypothetical protein ACE1B6_00130 [Aerosakkonemataceae cyanobacterium BLCC-F154]|uniref:Uncharacterized protein n=1 Tax=Floridaenema fluviatile BLCC-F154 TaxID=3153640 RepID=A0ABV4Y4K9_9CYAN
MMPRKFGEIAFTPEVLTAQSERGSRQTYAKYIANGPANDIITPKIAEWLSSKVCDKYF